jgi:hypothetical protein
MHAVASPTIRDDDLKRKRKQIDYGSNLKKPRISVDRAVVAPPSPPHSASFSGGRYGSDSDSDEDGHDGRSRSATRVRRNSRKLGQHPSSGHRRRKSCIVPESDLMARQRCVDYLITAIDEVWARYCDQTASAESERYNEGDSSSSANTNARVVEVELPSSPLSLYGDSEVESGSESSRSSSQVRNRVASVRQPRGRLESISEDPSSRALMALRQRLLKAKYFFLELIDSNDAASCAAFWHRWDLVKYAAIELVEEDGDDDEVVEAVTECLEEGRFYLSRC